MLRKDYSKWNPFVKNQVLNSLHDKSLSLLSLKIINGVFIMVYLLNGGTRIV